MWCNENVKKHLLPQQKAFSGIYLRQNLYKVKKVFLYYTNMNNNNGLSNTTKVLNTFQVAQNLEKKRFLTI